jgi:methionine-rich copper-binding protein CopC
MIRRSNVKNLIRMSAVAIAATAALFAVVLTASAHAHPGSSTPARGEVVQTSPASVQITFVEEIQKRAGTYNLGVAADGGASVTAGSPTIDPADASKLSVALEPNLAAGRYVVTWSNVSAVDGDAADGAFSFYVKTEPSADDLMKDANLGSVGAEAPAMPDMSAPAAGSASDMTPAAPSAAASPADMPAPAASAASDAPTVGQIVIAMTAQNGSGIDGRAEILPVDGGAKTQIGVYLNGVADSSMHMAMVHAGSACETGSHVADLNDVVANGTPHGGSVTVVDVPFSTIANGKNVIVAHGDGSSIVACGKIPAQPAAAALPKALPTTGSAGTLSGRSATFALLAALALAGTMIAAGGLAAAAKRNG